MITIITIVKNNKDGLRRTLRSAISQTVPYEHIIIDGCSTDGTLDVVQDFKESCVCYSSRDRGLSDAFNKGIYHSTGDYLLFLNSGDEFINKHILENAQIDIEKYNVDILFYKVQVDSETSIPSYRFEENETKIWSSADVPHQGAFIKKEVFDKVGEYSESFRVRMDFDFFARCVNSEVTHKYIPKIIVNYEPGGISMQSKNRKKFNREGIAIKLIHNMEISFKDYVKLICRK